MKETEYVFYSKLSNNLVCLKMQTPFLFLQLDNKFLLKLFKKMVQRNGNLIYIGEL